MENYTDINGNITENGAVHTGRSNKKQMKFEDAFRYIGDAGLFQLMLYFTTVTFNFFNGLHGLSANFFAAPMDHWCQIPRLANFSFDTQKHVGVPYKDGHPGEYDSCSMFNLNYDALSDDDILNWNRTSANSTGTIGCSGWVFDQSIFVSTISSKFDLVCDKSILSELTSTIYMAGQFFGSFVSGMISDRFGRRIPLICGGIGYFVFAFLQPFAPNYACFVVFRFFVSFCNTFSLLCSFVLRMELLGPKYYDVLMVFTHVFYSLGFMTVSGMAYTIRDMDKLLIAISTPLIFTVILIGIIPESPRWLLLNGKSEEATRVLKHIAEVNGRTFPDNVEWIVKEKQEAGTAGTCSEVCKSSILRGRLALMLLNWFAVALVYYGVSFNAGAFGDVFLNTFLSGLAEIPAGVLCYVCLSYGGRRFSNGGALLFAGAFSLACIPVLIMRPDMKGLLTALSTIGKGGITFAYDTVYVYTSELFPTQVRNVALGTGSTIGRIGSMASPLLGQTIEKIWKPMPSVIFGVIATVCGFLVFLLPESRGRPVPDTVQEAEEMSRKRHRTHKHEAHVISVIDISPENQVTQNGHVNSTFADDIPSDGSHISTML